MYTCRVFNDFSINPSYVMNFETRNEVNTFIERVSKSPYFLWVKVTGLNTILSALDDTVFEGHEYDQIMLALQDAKTRCSKKRFESIMIGDEITYEDHINAKLLTGIVTEKFAEKIIIGRQAIDPIRVLLFKNVL